MRKRCQECGVDAPAEEDQNRAISDSRPGHQAVCTAVCACWKVHAVTSGVHCSLQSRQHLHETGRSARAPQPVSPAGKGRNKAYALSSCCMPRLHAEISGIMHAARREQAAPAGALQKDRLQMTRGSAWPHTHAACLLICHVEERASPVDGGLHQLMHHTSRILTQQDHHRVTCLCTAPAGMPRQVRQADAPPQTFCCCEGDAHYACTLLYAAVRAALGHASV